MTNTTWAAKVLDGVPRWSAFQTRDVADRATDLTDRKWLRYDDALAAIAKLAEGDGLVERLRACAEETDGSGFGPIMSEAAAHIAALTAQLAEKEEQLVSVLRREAATHERHDAKMEAAEAEAAALRAKLARMEGALREIEADCNAAYPPSHGAIKYAIRLALITETKPQAADQREGGAE